MTDTYFSIRFPLHVMSGCALKFAEAYDALLESEIQLFYMSYLTLLGNMVADRLVMDTLLNVQPRLFCLLLGPTDSGKKSTAHEFTMKLFKGHVNFCSGIGSAEGLMRKLRNITTTKGNKNLTLVYDEFKAFIDKSSIQGSTLLPTVNELFGQNSDENVTKDDDNYVDNIYLSIIAASTVETYENSWKSAFTDIGFNNRLFIVTGETIERKSLPKKIKKTLIKELSADIESVLAFVGSRAELEFSTEGFKIYDTWYTNYQKSPHTHRIGTYYLRLAAILAVNEMTGVIGTEIAQKAVDLCEYQIAVRELHDPIDAETNVAKMEESIRRILRKRGALKEGTLKQYTNANRGAGLSPWRKALKNLQQEHEIVLNKDTRKWELI